MRSKQEIRGIVEDYTKSGMTRRESEFPGLVALLFLSIGCVGLTSPNATALTMAPHGKIAGNASAVLGCMQFAIRGRRRPAGQQPR